jgi:hypothetical protein
MALSTSRCLLIFYSRDWFRSECGIEGHKFTPGIATLYLCIETACPIANT